MNITTTRAKSVRLLFGGFLILLASGAFAMPAHAQEPLTGKFRCVAVEIGGQQAVCQSPPLVLNDDGSYEIWGEEGTYTTVQGRWLVLSHAKRRGLGHVVSPREIVFEYGVGKDRCKVTFRRIFDPPPGFSWT
jgi:hypothetical protein